MISGTELPPPDYIDSIPEDDPTLRVPVIIHYDDWAASSAANDQLTPDGNIEYYTLFSDLQHNSRFPRFFLSCFSLFNPHFSTTITISIAIRTFFTREIFDLIGKYAKERFKMQINYFTVVHPFPAAMFKLFLWRAASTKPTRALFNGEPVVHQIFLSFTSK